MSEPETFTSPVEIIDTTDSNYTTASLVIGGGITIYTSTNAYSLTQGGGLTNLGGMAVGGDTYLGNDIRIVGSETVSNLYSTGISTGTLNLYQYPKSGTPSTTGEYLTIKPSTFTDSTALANTSVANMIFNSIDGSTLSAINSNITTLNAISMYVKAPIAGANETILNKYSILADGDVSILGNTNISGDLTVNGVLFATGGSSSSGGGGISSEDVAYIREEKSIGSNGGTFTSGSWITRNLNTITGGLSYATLSSNQITLQPGLYAIEASAPAVQVDNHVCRLYNVTNSSVVAIGSSEQTDNKDYTSNRSVIGKQYFTLSTTSSLILQHKCNKTINNIGLGNATGNQIEVYSIVVISNIYAPTAYTNSSALFTEGTITNLVSTNISTGTLNISTGLSGSNANITSATIPNLNSTNISTLTLNISTGLSSASANITSATIPNLLDTNISTSTINISTGLTSGNALITNIHITGNTIIDGYLNVNPNSTAYIRDEKTLGSNGGTFASGIWRTRDLNTITGGSGWASLATNQITLISGTYLLYSMAPSVGVSNNTSRFYNVTDSSVVFLGSSVYSDGYVCDSVSTITQQSFTISGTKTFILQHKCLNTKTNIGFGTASGLQTEVYSVVVITKVA